MAREVLEQLRRISGQQSKIRKMREKLALFRQVGPPPCALSPRPPGGCGISAVSLLGLEKLCEVLGFWASRA